MTRNPKLARAYELARNDVGTVEWRDGHNPKVVQYFADVGHSWVNDDETAWCAAFTGSVLERAGLGSTRKLNARSYLDWGVAVDIKDAQPGDVVVFWRGSPDGWQGHVAQYVSHNATHVTVLGGNQSNAVNEKPYPISQLLGVRTMYEGNSNGGDEMETSAEGLYAIAKGEGLVPAPYLDPVNVWTFGIGHAETSGLDPVPSKMPRGMPSDIDAAIAQSIDLFKDRIKVYEDGVNRAITVPISQNEFDALVSFHYNTGAIARASATRVLNDGGSKSEVARRLALYNKAGGKKNQGLVNRREEENEVFIHGKYPSVPVPVFEVNANNKIGRVIRSIPKAEFMGLVRGKSNPVTEKKTHWLVALLRSIFG